MPAIDFSSRSIAAAVLAAFLQAASVVRAEPADPRRPRLDPSTGGQYVLAPIAEDDAAVGRCVWSFTASGVPVCRDRSFLLSFGDPAVERAYRHWCLGDFAGQSVQESEGSFPRRFACSAQPDGSANAASKEEGAWREWSQEQIGEIARAAERGRGSLPLSVDPNGFFEDLFLHLQEWMRQLLAANEPERQSGWFELYELDRSADAAPGAVRAVACASDAEMQAKRAEGVRALAEDFAKGSWRPPAGWDRNDFAALAFAAGQRRLLAKAMERPNEELPPSLRAHGRLYSSFGGGPRLLVWEEYERQVEEGVARFEALIESGEIVVPKDVDRRVAAEWRFHWSQLCAWTPDPPEPASASSFSTPAFPPPLSPAGAGSGSPGGEWENPFSFGPVGADGAPINPFGAPTLSSQSPFGGASPSGASPFGGDPFDGNPFGGGEFAGSPSGGASAGATVAASAPPPSRDEIIDSFAAAMARRSLEEGDARTARWIALQWIEVRRAPAMAELLDRLIAEPLRRPDETLSSLATLPPPDTATPPETPAPDSIPSPE